MTTFLYDNTLNPLSYCTDLQTCALRTACRLLWSAHIYLGIWWSYRKWNGHWIDLSSRALQVEASAWKIVKGSFRRKRIVDHVIEVIGGMESSISLISRTNPIGTFLLCFWKDKYHQTFLSRLIELLIWPSVNDSTKYSHQTNSNCDPDVTGRRGFIFDVHKKQPQFRE